MGNNIFRDKKVGFTCSCFDLLHAGHILMLKDSKEQCDYLIVGLQTDPTLDRPEKNKPIQSLKERRIQLEAVKYVDEVRVYSTESELRDMLVEIWPDVRILGEDYIGRTDFTGYDLPPKVIYTTRSHGWSTTKLKNLITKQTMEQNPNILKEDNNG